MLAERNELALQIAVLAKIHPKFTVSELAAALGWAPLFIVNALEEGRAMELFEVNREKDTLTVIPSHPLNGEQTLSPMGVELARLTDEILYKVASANKEEQDVSLEQLQWSWLKGLPLAHVELAIEVLVHNKLVEGYQLSDPYDKESVYTFYTLAGGNKDNQWGSKQFKPRSKAAKKRLEKKRGDK